MMNRNRISYTGLTAALASFAVRAACETLWPTRCAICDEQGAVLCERCKRALPFIDYWRACPQCGAPFGSVLCTECNPVMLATLGRRSLPYRSCKSAVTFAPEAARIVSAYKDRGEQRLADEMARLMTVCVPPERLIGARKNMAVTFVPATSAACSRRGFDHGELLAEHVASQLGTTVLPLLARPMSKDQRLLGRRERARNMTGRFAALPGAAPPDSALLVDDVCTTGSTLAEASDALLALGCSRVDCLTFARVW